MTYPLPSIKPLLHIFCGSFFFYNADICRLHIKFEWKAHSTRHIPVRYVSIKINYLTKMYEWKAHQKFCAIKAFKMQQ